MALMRAPFRGHSTNLVGIPTGLLCSADYNDTPVPLHIAGLRQMYPSLFEMLNQAESMAEAAEVFQDYMAVVFGLDQEQRDGVDAKGRHRFRSSYLRLLKGWGFDTNSPEGAVLKGWVESRFGLFPTFHVRPIERFSSEAWMGYVEQKMSSRFHNNAIQTQLDLLYEFCQWALGRFFSVGRRHVTLYRGVNDFAEQIMVERIDKRKAVVRLNSLVSFSSERDIASEFGDYILEARVPTSKILFFNALLPSAPLKGEAEYMVIGGDYRVAVSYF
ncbi:NAD(+)--dinitrogen-reductase ADP-D-ribosyltransferase [Telmatospirillum sp. J64-1]|uniref:NAD(+)--dinitrogen-reductase ADP-D-ribosyltransferase n=1 Tax=Telmatospirillum sp. J64-1 TaxID=2502183 RepID=UPI00115F2B6E|nr:NAD(+)--dinitrogen-reductase ADP-D-ribosyltransferase [Telmatospirillum sp. J64-1]